MKRALVLLGIIVILSSSSFFIPHATTIQSDSNGIDINSRDLRAEKPRKMDTEPIPGDSITQSSMPDEKSVKIDVAANSITHTNKSITLDWDQDSNGDDLIAVEIDFDYNYTSITHVNVHFTVYYYNTSQGYLIKDVKDDWFFAQGEGSDSVLFPWLPSYTGDFKIEAGVEINGTNVQTYISRFTVVDVNDGFASGPVNRIGTEYFFNDYDFDGVNDTFKRIDTIFYNTTSVVDYDILYEMLVWDTDFGYVKIDEREYNFQFKGEGTEDLDIYWTSDYSYSDIYINLTRTLDGIVDFNALWLLNGVNVQPYEHDEFVISWESNITVDFDGDPTGGSDTYGYLFEYVGYFPQKTTVTLSTDLYYYNSTNSNLGWLSRGSDYNVHEGLSQGIDYVSYAVNAPYEGDYTFYYDLSTLNKVWKSGNFDVNGLDNYNLTTSSFAISTEVATVGYTPIVYDQDSNGLVDTVKFNRNFLYNFTNWSELRLDFNLYKYESGAWELQNTETRKFTNSDYANKFINYLNHAPESGIYRLNVTFFEDNIRLTEWSYFEGFLDQYHSDGWLSISKAETVHAPWKSGGDLLGVNYEIAFDFEMPVVITLEGFIYNSAGELVDDQVMYKYSKYAQTYLAAYFIPADDGDYTITTMISVNGVVYLEESHTFSGVIGTTAEGLIRSYLLVDDLADFDLDGGGDTLPLSIFETMDYTSTTTVNLNYYLWRWDSDSSSYVYEKNYNVMSSSDNFGFQSHFVVINVPVSGLYKINYTIHQNGVFNVSGLFDIRWFYAFDDMQSPIIEGPTYTEFPESARITSLDYYYFDLDLDLFEVYLDEIAFDAFVVANPSMPHTYSLNLDPLFFDMVGEYNVTFVVRDQAGNMYSLQTMVNITDITVPYIVTSPDTTISYEWGSTGNVLVYNVTDNYPSGFEVLIDGVLWTDGTWNSADTVSINIDGLDVGTHTLVIRFEDESGNAIEHSVTIEVTEIPTSTTTSTSSTTSSTSTSSSSTTSGGSGTTDETSSDTSTTTPAVFVGFSLLQFTMISFSALVIMPLMRKKFR